MRNDTGSGHVPIARARFTGDRKLINVALSSTARVASRVDRGIFTEGPTDAGSRHHHGTPERSMTVSLKSNGMRNHPERSGRHVSDERSVAFGPRDAHLPSVQSESSRSMLFANLTEAR